MLGILTDLRLRLGWQKLLDLLMIKVEREVIVKNLLLV